MEAAAASAPPSELNRVGFRIYEAFRPEVPEDVEGWGAKGQLDPHALSRPHGRCSAVSDACFCYGSHLSPRLPAVAYCPDSGRPDKPVDMWKPLLALAVLLGVLDAFLALDAAARGKIQRVPGAPRTAMAVGALIIRSGHGRRPW